MTCARTTIFARAGGIAAFVGLAALAVAPAIAQESPGSYRIGPSDVLQIVVWKEPDLSRDVTVRLDGMITVPLLGDVLAEGQTPGQLAASLTKALRQLMEAPRVTVGISQAASSRFFVVGQVTRSGEYPLSDRTTVLQGLALAGGFREFAKAENIVVVRRDQTAVPVNYKRITDGKDLSQNILLSPGDTIVVP